MNTVRTWWSWTNSRLSRSLCSREATSSTNRLRRSKSLFTSSFSRRLRSSAIETPPSPLSECRTGQAAHLSHPVCHETFHSRRRARSAQQQFVAQTGRQSPSLTEHTCRRELVSRRWLLSTCVSELGSAPRLETRGAVIVTKSFAFSVVSPREGRGESVLLASLSPVPRLGSATVVARDPAPLPPPSRARTVSITITIVVTGAISPVPIRFIVSQHLAPVHGVHARARARARTAARGHRHRHAPRRAVPTMVLVVATPVSTPVSTPTPFPASIAVPGVAIAVARVVARRTTHARDDRSTKGFVFAVTLPSSLALTRRKTLEEENSPGPYPAAVPV